LRSVIAVLEVYRWFTPPPQRVPAELVGVVVQGVLDQQEVGGAVVGLAEIYMMQVEAGREAIIGEGVIAELGTQLGHDNPMR
jgi:hypothetical protein